MSKVAEAKNVYPSHRFFPARVRFCGEIPHGKSTRSIAVDVDPELICKIADALRTVHKCHRRSGDEITTLDGLQQVWRDQIGHAMWHVTNPEAVMPCLDHNSKVIDVEAGRSYQIGTAAVAPNICSDCHGPIDENDECRCEPKAPR